MTSLLKVAEAIQANEVSYLFSAIIVAVFGLCILSRLPGFARLLGKFDRSGATIMTTIGVLGTFVGIFIGLLDFEVSRIDDSVPKLLEGLKIAFATSIVGMGGAILFKLVQTLTPSPIRRSMDVTPATIHTALLSIDDNVKASAEQERRALDEIRKAISADSEGSLLTQVQKLRTTVQDGQQQLIQEFKQFAATMAENNSKALIEALERVIRDFNTQLNEQFGDNFKQLNQAVGALLGWQENYRRHVETLEERIAAAVEALEDSRSAISEIASHTKSIPDTLSPLRGLLLGLHASTTELAAHLEAVASLKQDALEAFPVIEGNIKKLTDGFSEGVNSSVKAIESTVNEQKHSFDQLRNGYNDLVVASNEAQATFNRAHQAALEGMRGTLRTAMEGHAAAIDATARQLQEQIGEAWTKTQEAINEQLQALDTQMQDELTRALTVLGRNLASLSKSLLMIILR